MSVSAEHEIERDQYTKATPSIIQQMDWIPLVSNVTGTVRIIFGTMETILGVVTFIPEVIYDLVKGTSHIFIISEGVKNIFRGIVAHGIIVGNIALYLYDTSRVTRI